MPEYHPDEALLLDYASGAQDEAEALIIATHLSFCSTCRDTAKLLEAAGGALLGEAPGEPLTGAWRARMTAAMDEAGEAASAAAETAVHPDTASLPQPLRNYVSAERKRLAWPPSLGPSEIRLMRRRKGGPDIRLMRIRAGTAMPRHGHAGEEFTLVLQGGFADDAGHYRPGDFAFADRGIEHQPRADVDGDCICLAVSRGPVRLKGLLGRIVNPFLGDFI